MEKMTKMDAYEMIRGILVEAEEGQIDGRDELVAFVETEMEHLAVKAEKAKERAAKKRAAGDELREAVAQVLTNEYQTIDQILERLEGEDLTRSKISARLTQLVNSGEVEKEQQKMDGRKVMGYRLMGGVNEATEG